MPLTPSSQAYFTDPRPTGATIRCGSRNISSPSSHPLTMFPEEYHKFHSSLSVAGAEPGLNRAVLGFSTGVAQFATVAVRLRVRLSDW